MRLSYEAAIGRLLTICSIATIACIGLGVAPREVVASQAFADDAPGVSTYPVMKPYVPPMPPPQQRPGAPSQPGQPAGAPGSGDAIQEVQQTSEAYRKAYESINAMNPMSADYGKLPDGTAGAPGSPGADPNSGQGFSILPPETLAQLEQLRSLMANPLFQKYLKLFQNPAFIKSASDLASHPNRKWLLISEVLLAIAMIGFRAWRQSKAEGWWGRFKVSLYCSVLFWVLAIVAIPPLVLGDPYLQFLKGLKDAFLTG